MRNSFKNKFQKSKTWLDRILLSGSDSQFRLGFLRAKGWRIRILVFWMFFPKSQKHPQIFAYIMRTALTAVCYQLLECRRILKYKWSMNECFQVDVHVQSIISWSDHHPLGPIECVMNHSHWLSSSWLWLMTGSALAFLNCWLIS